MKKLISYEICKITAFINYNTLPINTLLGALGASKRKGIVQKPLVKMTSSKGEYLGANSTRSEGLSCRVIVKRPRASKMTSLRGEGFLKMVKSAPQGARGLRLMYVVTFKKFKGSPLVDYLDQGLLISALNA